MMESAKIYRSFRDAAKQMPDGERLKFWDALMDYALDGIEPDLDGIAGIVFTAIRPTIDTRTESVMQGAKGGRPKKGGSESTKRGVFENQKGGFLETEKGGFEEPKTYIEAEAEEYTEDIKEKHSKKKFFPPSVDDVRSYCNERGNSVNPEAFIAYYSSNGWKVGRNPMKDWKAAVRTWENKEKSRPPTAWGNVPKRAYDMNDLEGRLVGL